MIVFRRKRNGPDGKVIVADTYSARHRFAGDKNPTTIPLRVTRKDVAEQRGREWVAREERQRAGLIVDPVELHAAETPIVELIEEFRQSLKARGLEADYVRKPVQRCRDLCDILSWRRLADANPMELRRYLEGSNWSPTTRNHYLDAVKQLFRWLHRDGRIPHSPIADVPRFKVAFTETYDRAAFTEDELVRLIDPKTTDKRRLYRADVYALMVFSGLRWTEAGRLQVRDIRRDDDGYSIMIPRGKDKANRGDVIELQAELEPVIERLVAERNPRDKLMHAGLPTRHTFRRDCERAGIEHERADGSRIVRYSSRDTYTSLLRALARSTDQLRALTRHRTRGMEDRYTDRKTQGLRTLVNRMPVVVPGRAERERQDTGPCVKDSVNTPTHATETGIPRGFDSPRLHFQTPNDKFGLIGTLCSVWRHLHAGRSGPGRPLIRLEMTCCDDARCGRHRRGVASHGPVGPRSDRRCRVDARRRAA
ncbi:MAG: hypothetical protein DHS20C14_01640 [Phycisphaeraceae bacterium]|nr:MAG: hypothetical protein DHS20C14_01640 [Phycisphaeraceae bacterium]